MQDSTEPRRTVPAGGSARARRFFTSASVRQESEGYAVVLDGRPARTPARRLLAFPTPSAAEAVAAEWNGLGDAVDPRAMPLTRIANAAIDGVADLQDAVFDEVMRYVASDLLLYRAAEAPDLAAEQAAAWDPVLDWATAEFGARFQLGEGIVHVAQPPATLSILRQALAEAVGEGQGSALRLTCLDVMTTLTGSALLALAVARGRIDAAAAWTAAHVDEVFQERRWGEDAEALERRSGREAEMRAAARLYRLSLQ